MSDQPKKRRGPSRLFILAAPVGAWVAITRAADGPVAEAGAIGGGIAVAALVVPVVLRGAGKAAGGSKKKKSKTTKSDTSKDSESK